MQVMSHICWFQYVLIWFPVNQFSLYSRYTHSCPLRLCVLYVPSCWIESRSEIKVTFSQRWCLLLHIPERNQRDYRRADGDVCPALTRHSQRSSSAEDNAPKKCFCLNSAEIMSERKQRRRSEDERWRLCEPRCITHRPISRCPGVWLALWWQTFTMDTAWTGDFPHWWGF